MYVHTYTYVYIHTYLQGWEQDAWEPREKPYDLFLSLFSSYRPSGESQFLFLNSRNKMEICGSLPTIIVRNVNLYYTLSEKHDIREEPSVRDLLLRFHHS